VDQKALVNLYVEAWNRKNVSELMSLMHPGASYYDAFWGEICYGSDLARFFTADFEVDTRRYQQDGEIITTPNGLILRYLAFEHGRGEKERPVYPGAEIITVSDGLIMTISDIYCDPDPVQLAEVAKCVQERHSRSIVAPQGLGARTSGYINRRLEELADNTTVFLDASLTVTRLAQSVGCSTAHLSHVLEHEKGSTFIDFVNESRVRYAATLLTARFDGTVDVLQIARQSGFGEIEEFDEVFKATFGMKAEEYSRRFD